ncbi:MAG: hypothetical protein M3Q48_03690 [Actinomycetota bacterium]|nr:hypothetical protein [Actinomycetota bacterium]
MRNGGARDPHTRAHRTQPGRPAHRGSRRLHQPVPPGWGAYFRHGNSSACFDAIEYFVTERMVLFISNKHQKRGRWFGRRVLFGSPTRLGLVRLAGTVSAARPNRWR